jgi:hypothetical protein
MMRKSLLVLAVSAAVTVAAFAASTSVQKSTVTVGDFATKIARVLGKPAATPQAAVDSLKSLGVKVGDASARLTEGDAARILGDLGVSVRTQSPGTALSAGKADQLLANVSLSSAATSIEATTLPGQCLELRNRGQCDTCCTLALGCDVDSSLCAGGICAKFCRAVLPPGQASPTDPIP